MCTSYERAEDEYFEGLGRFPALDFQFKREIYKDYPAPIFRRAADGFSADPATFAMVPRKRITPGVRLFDTMNARAETVGEKRHFKGAWNSQQLCLIPCKWFYEPNYELDPDQSVRWRIGMASGDPLLIAGLWRAWDEPDGGQSLSFTMLTVNAAEHSLMRRFHKPKDEKRSVVIVPPSEYENWLSCRSTDEARSFLNLYPAELMRAEPYPLPPRKAKPKAAPDDSQPSLLGSN